MEVIAYMHACKLHHMGQWKEPTVDPQLSHMLFSIHGLHMLISC